MDWLELEVKKEQYRGLHTERIYHYLNAPRITEEPNADEQPLIASVPSVMEIIEVIEPNEWKAIRSSATDWFSVSDSAIDAGLAMQAQALDAALMGASGAENMTLLKAVSTIINSESPELASHLIEVLVATGILSIESASALQVVMVKPDPEWSSTVYVVSPSIAESSVGIQIPMSERPREVSIAEIEEALSK